MHCPARRWAAGSRLPGSLLGCAARPCGASAMEPASTSGGGARWPRLPRQAHEPWNQSARPCAAAQADSIGIFHIKLKTERQRNQSCMVMKTRDKGRKKYRGARGALEVRKTYFSPNEKKHYRGQQAMGRLNLIIPQEVFGVLNPQDQKM